jgi:hypothetical protein
VKRRTANIVHAIVLGVAIAILGARLFAAPSHPASNDSKRERTVYRRANA